MDSLNIQRHGFHGCFYPAGNRKDKAIIVITGSDGGIGGARAIAKFYASRNIPALAVAYFKTKWTPKYLEKIPVEYIESAVNWLKTQGYEKIAVDGISKGAELALLAGSLIPDITCVIARSPIYFVCEGLGKGRNPSGASSWSWRGADLPCTMFTGRDINVMKDFLRTREFSVIRHYRNIIVTDESIIPIEKINGPVLILSSRMDTMCPATEYGEKICGRLAANGFQYPYRHETYNTVSHYLTPIDMRIAKILYKVERKQPDACGMARKEALAATLDWINNVWN